MAGPSGNIFAVHSALVTMRNTIAHASETLNGTVQGLMNEIAGHQQDWKGSGATSYTALMARYHEDQKVMNKALLDLGNLVSTADAHYVGADDGVSGTFVPQAQ